MCTKPGTYSQNKYSHPRLSGVILVVFWITGAWPNSASDLMFQCVAYCCFHSPGERGVITLAIKKDAPFSMVEKGAVR